MRRIRRRAAERRRRKRSRKKRNKGSSVRVCERVMEFRKRNVEEMKERTRLRCACS